MKARCLWAHGTGWMAADALSILLECASPTFFDTYPWLMVVAILAHRAQWLRVARKTKWAVAGTCDRLTLRTAVTVVVCCRYHSLGAERTGGLVASDLTCVAGTQLTLTRLPHISTLYDGKTLMKAKIWDEVTCYICHNYSVILLTYWSILSNIT